MENFFGLFLLLFLCFACHQVEAQSRTNFKIKRYELCATDTLIKFVGNVTTENDGQYLTFNAISPIPFDENVGAIFDIESMLNSKTVVPLFTIREKYLCQAANKYMGEFWYDIIRAAQLTPKVCPVRAGRHHVHHVYLNYKAITLQTFPFGRLRFTLNVIDNKKPKETLLCLLIEVENMIN